MTLVTAGKVNYQSRIERAQLLAERLPFAREILGVYAEVARYQRDFYERLPKRWGKPVTSGVARQPFVISPPSANVTASDSPRRGASCITRTCI